MRRLLIGLVACVLLSPSLGGAGEIVPASAAGAEQGEVSPVVLDLADRTLVQPVERARQAPGEARLVEVVIAGITNPRLIRIMFEVHYRPPTGADVALGVFSPFPPDNPGTFIVPTRGVVGGEGAIVLSMVVLDEVGPEDEVRVEVEAISLRRN